MLIKKRAIKNKIKFRRYKDYNNTKSICEVSGCKNYYSMSSHICNLCNEIFFATKRELSSRIYYAKIKYFYIYDSQEI